MNAANARPTALDAASNAKGSTTARAIAAVRIATGIIFLLFAEYKIAGTEFTPAGFEHWVRGWLDQDQAVGFYRPVLLHLALAHPLFCARLVAWGELAIALSLIFGILVRPASIAGIVLMLNFIFSTWYAPGHNAPLWQYFGASLDHVPLLFLFVIFYVSRAGNVWSLDGWLRVLRRQQ